MGKFTLIVSPQCCKRLEPGGDRGLLLLTLERTDPLKILNLISWDSLTMTTGKGRKKNWRPFEEAREFARGLGLTGRKKWLIWAKTVEKPEDIPASPPSVYKDKGWIDWGDWLGTGNTSPVNISNWAERVGFIGLESYLPFEEARAFVRKLGLKNSTEWTAWAKTSEKPDSIPADPVRVYKDNWLGIGDWIGATNVWNRNSILSFLKGIQPILKDLDPSELYAIMRQNNMLAASKGK